MSIFESVIASIDFIEANLHHDIGVLDVANAVSYSQFYFSREFSRHTHISIYDYIVRRKISEACKDLFKADARIVDLAFHYGFQSHEVFTRAFKKVFGENPSEVKIFKPLAVFEPIDVQYLNFLQDLKVEFMVETVEECFFELGSGAELDDTGSILVMLSQQNPYAIESTYKGSPRLGKSPFLSFTLSHLGHKVRLYHTNASFAFRYFIEHLYNATEISSNFILLKRSETNIDVLIPCK